MKLSTAARKCKGRKKRAFRKCVRRLMKKGRRRRRRRRR